MHVVGTTAGEFTGVAKRASPFAVKTLDDQGAGPLSEIIGGLNGVSRCVALLHFRGVLRRRGRWR